MADVVDAATRSRMMAGIRTKNTRPEIIIRKGLHARGFRYSLHPKGLPGKPDIAMPKWHVAIFIHGCFWHGHGCSLSRLPASNTAFWESKLAANQCRDELVKNQLAASGWRTATVWECATRGRLARESLAGLIDRLAIWIRDQDEPPTLEIAGSDLFMSSPSAGNNSTRI
jgi:DNA mismatch endonuclease (patch repair protein)